MIILLKYLNNAIPMILDLTEAELKDWVQERKGEYLEVPLSEISITAGVSNLDYVLKEDQNILNLKPGEKYSTIPIGARSALVHNKYIKENNLEDTYTLISPGDKTKRLYLREPNPLNSNIIAYTDDNFIEIFKDYIDFDLNFEKGFMGPLNIMTTALKWNLENTMEALDDW